MHWQGGDLLYNYFCVKNTLIYQDYVCDLVADCYIITVKQQGAFYEILFMYLNSSLDNITVHDSARKEQIHICLVVCNFLSRPI